MIPILKKLNVMLVPLALLLLSSQVASAWYDPGTQRWINRDPVLEAGDVNVYRFGRSDPANTVDPLGLQIIIETPPVIIEVPPEIIIPRPVQLPIEVPIPTFPPVPRPLPPRIERPRPIPRPSRSAKCNAPQNNPYHDAKRKCIDECSDASLPTPDHGASFWKCLRDCMEREGFPGVPQE